MFPSARDAFGPIPPRNGRDGAAGTSPGIREGSREARVVRVDRERVVVKIALHEGRIWRGAERREEPCRPYLLEATRE
jgi:hypothetical protein